MRARGASFHQQPRNNPGRLCHNPHGDKGAVGIDWCVRESEGRRPPTVFASLDSAGYASVLLGRAPGPDSGEGFPKSKHKPLDGPQHEAKARTPRRTSRCGRVRARCRLRNHRLRQRQWWRRRHRWFRRQRKRGQQRPCGQRWAWPLRTRWHGRGRRRDERRRGQPRRQRRFQRKQLRHQRQRRCRRPRGIRRRGRTSWKQRDDRSWRWRRGGCERERRNRGGCGHRRHRFRRRGWCDDMPGRDV
jgi:hypothetical protein